MGNGDGADGDHRPDILPLTRSVPWFNGSIDQIYEYRRIGLKTERIDLQKKEETSLSTRPKSSTVIRRYEDWFHFI